MPSLSDIEIPLSLRSLPRAPQRLYYHGNVELLCQPLLAVVGARQASAWVQQWIEHELSEVLRQRKVTLVSGGARGVDQWAHRLAVRMGRATLVVTPSGLDCLYPKSLADLWDHPRVLFLSEYPPEQAMMKHHFYRRNQLIASLVPVVVILQASEKSGTMITARFALEQGKTLAVLPGAALDRKMAGNNQLLFEGAQLVRNASDLIQIIDSHFHP